MGCINGSAVMVCSYGGAVMGVQSPEFEWLCVGFFLK